MRAPGIAHRHCGGQLSHQWIRSRLQTRRHWLMDRHSEPEPARAPPSHSRFLHWLARPDGFPTVRVPSERRVSGAVLPGVQCRGVGGRVGAVGAQGAVVVVIPQRQS